MCPVCIANVMLTAAAATSTGSLASFTVKYFFQPDRNHQTNETKQNENRDNGTTKSGERNESFQGRVRS
jgi:hypothetical protein